jgi:cytidylate kinase
MSIVAISETAGSMGIEIGRKLAESLGWEFADREILSKASEQFGEDVTDLRHSIEEKPTLWERFSDTQHRYKAYVEAIMLEMAARDNVVLAGRSSTIVLRQVPHVVRARASAPEGIRAQRLENESAAEISGNEPGFLGSQRFRNNENIARLDLARCRCWPTFKECGRATLLLYK